MVITLSPGFITQLRHASHYEVLYCYKKRWDYEKILKRVKVIIYPHGEN